MALHVARPFHPPPRRCTRAHSVSPSTETRARPVLQEALHVSPGGPQWSRRRPPGDACPRRRRRLCHLPRMSSLMGHFAGHTDQAISPLGPSSRRRRGVEEVASSRSGDVGEWGGCYSAYACSRKLRGRLSNLSFVLPVTDHEAGASDSFPSKDNGGKDAPEAALVGKTTAAEFARRYVLGRELGRGEFGVTRRCKDAATGEALACKTIRRHRRRARRVGVGAGAAVASAAAAAAAHAVDVRREVAIMRRMSSRGGAAVVRLREACEDADGAVHLVMELCEGGELFDRIVARGHYSERAAANIFRTIVDVIQLCHSNGVMHRDLKPENFLFANKSEDSPLKVIDFGLSVFFNPGDRFTEVVGSAYYMAPEVLKRSYGPEVDVWSAGVILYILLCGVPPFWGDNDEKIAQAILRGGIDFNREPWPRVSGNAKDLVRRMLDPDPSTRLTARQVLEHPWLKNADMAPNVSLGDAVRARLQQFSAMNKFKKKALGVVARNLPVEELDKYVQMLHLMDKDKNGNLSLEELMEGLHINGAHERRPASGPKGKTVADAARASLGLPVVEYIVTDAPVEGVDLLAGVEAIISHVIVKEFKIPAAHARADMQTHL